MAVIVCWTDLESGVTDANDHPEFSRADPDRGRHGHTRRRWRHDGQRPLRQHQGVVRMTYRQKTLTRAVWCDKPGCEETLRVPNPNWAPYQSEFRDWYRSTGWSIWVNRGQRHYCPDHGPSPKSRLRRVER